eukprot:3158-Heterococcus_DN1.PRE.1
MDDDYTVLLGRPPPSTGTRQKRWQLSWLPIIAALLSAATVLLSCLLFWTTGKYKFIPGKSSFKVPTLSRYGTYTPASERLNVLKIAVLCTQYMILTTCASTGSYVWAAGLHLTALACLPVWWGVRMAHKQRLAALTGLSKYDGRAGRAALWTDVACTVGTGFSIAWFLLGSAPPEKVYDGVLAGQD